MATRGIRINKARNFAGKLYLTETEALPLISGGVQSALIDSATLSGNNLTIYQSGGVSKVADLKGLVTAGNSGIAVTNNAVSVRISDDEETAKYLTVSNGGIAIKGLTDAIDGANDGAFQSAMDRVLSIIGYDELPTGSKTVDSRLDDVETTLSTLSGGAVMGISGGTAISVTSGTGGIYTVGVDSTVARSVTATPTVSGSITNGALSLTTRLKLAKKATATDGYVATYILADADGNQVGTEVINIPKDQFLQDAKLVWGTSADLDNTGKAPGESATKTASAMYPFLKLLMYVEGGSASATAVYIPVTSLFHDVVAGTGISVEQTSGGNVVSLDTSYLGSNYLPTFEGSNGFVPQIASNGSALTNGRAIVTTITSGGTSLPTDGAVYNAVQSAKDYVSGAYLPQLASAASNNDKIALFTSGGKEVKAGNAITSAVVTSNGTAIPTEKSVYDSIDALRTKFNNGGLYTISSATVSITSGMTTLSSSLAGITTKEGVYKVLDGNGDVIYPDIQSYADSGAVIEADFGAGAEAAENWTVYYFKAVTLN